MIGAGSFFPVTRVTRSSNNYQTFSRRSDSGVEMKEHDVSSSGTSCDKNPLFTQRRSQHHAAALLDTNCPNLYPPHRSTARCRRTSGCIIWCRGCSPRLSCSIPAALLLLNLCDTGCWTLGPRELTKFVLTARDKMCEPAGTWQLVCFIRKTLDVCRFTQSLEK